MREIITYLTVKNASKAIEFYAAAFGATELFRLSDPASGTIGHAEIMLNGSHIMLADENLAWGSKSPQTRWATMLASGAECPAAQD